LPGGAPGVGGERREGPLPRRRAELAVLADIGPVEPLRAQAVDDMARLVGDPLLVHGLVYARQDESYLAAVGVGCESLSSFPACLMRCRRRIPSRPGVATGIPEPTPSMTSTDWVLPSSQG